MKNYKEKNQEIKNGFKKQLNRHGYGFQYEVLKLIKDMYRQKSRWLFEVAEFPVEVHGYGTRIDFILQHISKQILMLAECKRANPSLSNWCFAKAPYVTRNREFHEPLFIEFVQVVHGSHVISTAELGYHLEDACHIALEVKSKTKGDVSGNGRNAIESAVTQICRGVNGMVEFLSENHQIFHNNSGLFLFPVIFTTANIWVSDVDLSSTDLLNGEIDLNNTKFEIKPWIFYQYHLSPGLKHSYSPSKKSNKIGEILDMEYIRSIAIVSRSGIEQFLTKYSDPKSFIEWENFSYYYKNILK